MRVLLFYHSLLSDWNHGNAHFLRGIATELISRGHEVVVYEPRGSWSASNLLAGHGRAPFRAFHCAYPLLGTRRYDISRLDLRQALDGADIVIVHEWNVHDLVREIGRHRAQSGKYRLYFHDTHHRMVTDPDSMRAYELSNYDGVLAYGRILEELYTQTGRVRHAWTWHEAADTRVFHPLPDVKRERDLVWIGNWGDDERSAELQEFLIQPSRALNLKARVYGVRYPESAKAALAEAGMEHSGWLPNFEVPRVFAQFKVTVHVPRRPYVEALPGIPTIRPFEALACGIPLVSSPWTDAEELFRPGRDYLVARNGAEMVQTLQGLLSDPELRAELAESGLATIRSRHTCAHRVNELLAIDASVREDGRLRKPVAVSSGTSATKAAFQTMSNKSNTITATSLAK